MEFTNVPNKLRVRKWREGQRQKSLSVSSKVDSNHKSVGPVYLALVGMGVMICYLIDVFSRHNDITLTSTTIIIY